MVYNGYNKTKEADIMNKKFYMIVRDEYGNVIFNHKSNKAKRLIALYNKEAFSAVFLSGIENAEIAFNEFTKKPRISDCIIWMNENVIVIENFILRDFAF